MLIIRCIRLPRLCENFVFFVKTNSSSQTFYILTELTFKTKQLTEPITRLETYLNLSCIGGTYVLVTSPGGQRISLLYSNIITIITIITIIRVTYCKLPWQVRKIRCNAIALDWLIFSEKTGA